MDGQEEKRQTTKKDKRNKKTTRGELNLVRLGFNEGKVLSSLEKLCRQQSICHPRTPKFFIWLSMHFGNNINELNLAAQPPYIWKLDNWYALSISVQWAWASQINSMNIICYCSVLCCGFPSVKYRGISPFPLPQDDKRHQSWPITEHARDSKICHFFPVFPHSPEEC